LLAPIIKLGGGFVASNLLAFVANLLAAAGVYALTCRRFSQLAGSVSAVCYLVAAVVYAGTEPVTETFLAAALVGSLLAYDHHLDTGGQLSLAVAGGAVGVATLFKQPAVAVGAAGVAHLSIRAENWRSAVATIWPFAVGANGFAVANESSGLSGQRAVAADINQCVPDDERLLVLGFPQYYTLTDRYPDQPNVYYFEVNRNVTYTDASLLRRINRTGYVLLTHENHPRVYERLRETWRTAGQWTKVAHVMTLFVHPDADLPCRRADGPSSTT
jgi:hypothetical protein